MKNIDRIRGCLIGGAVGDALGYPVEFMAEREIFAKYGERGITDYDLTAGKALISDDTQMTLYTANGLLFGTTGAKRIGLKQFSYVPHIASSYKDWYCAQTGDPNKTGTAWLNDIPEMHKRRAPGTTCLLSLAQEHFGTVEAPINNSKGCGGVMRVAPIGLYFDAIPFDDSDRIGAEAAAVTHGHELGYLPAAMLVHIIRLLSQTEISVADAVRDAEKAMALLFPQAKHLPELLALTDEALLLAEDPDTDDLAAIHQLGEGWVAEETLAISIYCAARYPDDFEKAVVASVNHSGDSDSTGAVTGNILGAALGLHAIPEKYLNDLERKDIVLELADDLYNDCPEFKDGQFRDERWQCKYIHRHYPGK